MLTGTLVTAIGFLPIGLANSAVGEYAGGIFWVVGIALVASWFVAVIFTPYLGVKLLPNVARKAPSRRSQRRLQRALLSRVSPRARILRAPAARRHRRHRDVSRPRPQRLQPCAAAILSAVGTAGIVPRNAAGRGLVDRGDVEGRARGASNCSPATRTPRPIRPISARVRRASGSACCRCSPMSPSRRW